MRRAGARGDGPKAVGRRAVLTFAIPLALLAGSAGAQLEVDASGGALTLPEETTAALQAWRDALPAEELPEPGASVAFAPDLLGPDTLSLTLRWDDGRTEVLLSPARYRGGPVLLHEIGVLLGVPSGGGGVMDPAIGAGAPAAPTEEDLALLRELRAYPAEDITRDGAVDFYDLAALGTAWGSVGVNLRADLDGDGRVGDADLAILREAYTFGPPSQATPPPLNVDPGAAPVPDVDPASDAEPGSGAGSAPEADDEPADGAVDDDGAGSGGSEGDGEGTPADGVGEPGVPDDAPDDSPPPADRPPPPGDSEGAD